MLEFYGAPHSFHVFLRRRPSTATSMRRVHLKMLLSLYGSVSTCVRDPASSDSEVPGSPTRQPRWGGPLEGSPAKLGRRARASGSLEPIAPGVGPWRRGKGGAPRAV